MKYSVVTFGCRVNQADSLAIEGGLRQRGGVAASPEEAELVIVNTCSVTASADQGARQTIRRIARVNPSVRIVVTGCYATRRPAEVAELPNVVRVIENGAKESLIADVANELGLTTAVRFGDGDGPCGHTLEPGVAGRTALTLRVQTGCEERCSYCIIPQTRGPSRSRTVGAVLEDVERAVAAGYKEIVITGVHLGSFGRDLHNGASLSGLLRALAAAREDVLFRVSSLEPMDCTDEIVDIVAASPRLAPHFHLPLQNGSNEVLRMMRRPYTVEFYARLVKRIVTLIPHAAVGSDIIVGFPGETAEQFEETVRHLQEIPLAYLHVFPYSDRPGTAASTRRPKVDGAVIRDRAHRVREIGAQMTSRFRTAQIGRVSRALTVDDGGAAVTPNYLKLRLDVKRGRNEWIDVRVDDEHRGHVMTAAAAPHA